MKHAAADTMHLLRLTGTGQSLDSLKAFGKRQRIAQTVGDFGDFHLPEAVLDRDDKRLPAVGNDGGTRDREASVVMSHELVPATPTFPALQT